MSYNLSRNDFDKIYPLATFDGVRFTLIQQDPTELLSVYRDAADILVELGNSSEYFTPVELDLYDRAENVLIQAQKAIGDLN